MMWKSKTRKTMMKKTDRLKRQDRRLIRQRPKQKQKEHMTPISRRLLTLKLQRLKSRRLQETRKVIWMLV